MSKIVVVLGMHRSGTSAITRGLQVLGVELGERLMEPIKANNDKGFWEDVDLNSLNIEMLAAIGSDWNAQSPIRKHDVDTLHRKGYFLRAVELLRQKASTGRVFGFKDPRMAKLLVFWKEVFEHCGFEASYVLAIRHPLSVVKSLRKLWDIEPGQCYLLWLSHVLLSIVGSAQSEAVLVDYDYLMRSPDRELERIGTCLGLAIDPIELQHYKEEFLDEGLRHTTYRLNDLLLDEACPQIVIEVYEALLDVASQKMKLDDPGFRGKVAAWASEFERLQSILSLVDRIVAIKGDVASELAKRNAELASRNEQIARSTQDLAERDVQIAGYTHEVAVRDGKLITLYQAVAERDWQIVTNERMLASLNATLVERDREIASLNAVTANQVQQIANFSATMVDRDREIAHLSATTADLEREFANLNMEIADANKRIALLTAERTDMLGSKSWRYTKPLRELVLRVKAWRSYFRGFGIFNVGANPLSLLPMSSRNKQILKQTLFTKYAFLFKWSKAYRRWNAINLISGQNSGQVGQTLRLAEALAAVRAEPLYEGPPPTNTPVRLIAFYLPQFHSIPENDRWWGQGFTEWSNVEPAKPLFEGHYQPHVPGELGYYNLLDPGIQRRQVELAKLYGLGGFCFYSYWFGGKVLLEQPVENYLKDASLDLPFCLCWANENWTRRWDGYDREVLIAQQHSPEDDLRYIEYVSRYLRDKRYIRIDGKPLLLVYRPKSLPAPKETSKRWRKWCRENGIGEIFLAYTQSFEKDDPSVYDFDAAIEFPPNNSAPTNVTERVKFLSDAFQGVVHDWRIFVERSRNYKEPDYKLFRGVCPSWDNTPRMKNRATAYVNSSPEGYQEWLSNAIRETCNRFKNPDERLVFVNAWNEWAEGAYLEPDQLHGYAYLEATRKALDGHPATNSLRRMIVVSHDAHPHGAQYLALGMVRSLKKDLHLEVEVVLLGGGRLSDEFAKLAPIHEISGAAEPKADTLARLAKSFAERGFLRAIANTCVSGQVLPIFSQFGIETVCLVHELPGVIQSNRLEESAKWIAAYAKAVVFPAQVVADGFSKFASVSPDRQIIRPQGLFRRNRWRFEKATARAKLREQLGLSLENKIVLAVGFADYRKGVDLFVESALAILASRHDVDFVWVGHWEPEMQKKIDAQLSSNARKDRIHFVGYVSDPALFYAGADVYALTSREDPFPNVVLESFEAGLPVVAFASSGGAVGLVEEVGGIVVPMQDVANYASAICRLLDDESMSFGLGASAQNHVEQHFAFRAYLFDLCEMLGIRIPKVSVIVPNFNYARYLDERLSSIVNQSIPVFELIILDDASTDQSPQKISQWLEATGTDARVVRNRVNSGNVFAQWRRGFSLASGDYLWIAEADDLSEPDFLETVLPPLVSNQAVLSYCESQQINSDGFVLADNYHDYLRVVSQDRWKSNYIQNGLEEIKNTLAVLNTIPNVSAVVFKRDAIQSVFDKYFDEISQFRRAGDWIVYFRTLLYGDIAFSARAANRHRRHDGSVIGGVAAEVLLEEIVKVQQTISNECEIPQSVKDCADGYRKILQECFE